MQIIDYIDFHSIFKKVKENHLSLYPTEESYIEELQDNDESFEYVHDLYLFLKLRDVTDKKCNNSDNSDDSILNIVDNKITIEFSIGGNGANESTNHNEWGYGYLFTIDLENELFVGYSFENYS